MMPWPLLALVSGSLAMAADLTFVEATSSPQSNLRHERTVSVSGSRIAIDSDDVTIILDRATGTVNEVDRARAEFNVSSLVAFQAKIAMAREELEAAFENLAEDWSDVEVDFPEVEPGPRLLNVDTTWLRWSLTARLNKIFVYTLTNECALGKVEGWRDIRKLQGLEFGAAGLSIPASSRGQFQGIAQRAQERLAAVDGALLRCVIKSRMEGPSAADAGPPLEQAGSTIEIVSLKPNAEPGLFRIPADYKAAEFPLTELRILAYLALPLE